MLLMLIQVLNFSFYSYYAWPKACDLCEKDYFSINIYIIFIFLLINIIIFF